MRVWALAKRSNLLSILTKPKEKPEVIIEQTKESS